MTLRRVKALAKTGEASASQVVVELIERGLEAHDRERQRFMQLTDRLAQSTGDAEEKQVTEELADMIFGADESAEAKRRLEEVRTGAVKPVPWEEAERLIFDPSDDPKDR